MELRCRMMLRKMDLKLLIAYFEPESFLDFCSAVGLARTCTTPGHPPALDHVNDANIGTD